MFQKIQLIIKNVDKQIEIYVLHLVNQIDEKYDIE